MWFKDTYRKYKAEEARKKCSVVEEKTINTAPNSPMSSPASSSGSERESRYFEITQLKKIYEELDHLTAHINDLKNSIRLLEKNKGEENIINFQTSLVRAFEKERNELNVREFNEPFKAI